jgi:aldose 1-epimerase
LGDVTLDTGFANLDRDVDGRVRHTLTAPDGRRVALWQGEGFDYVQVYTTTGYPEQELAVAIEPMTAPADAFNSGLGIRRLAPGETWTLEWGVELG